MCYPATENHMALGNAAFDLWLAIFRRPHGGSSWGRLHKDPKSAWGLTTNRQVHLEANCSRITNGKSALRPTASYCLEANCMLHHKATIPPDGQLGPVILVWFCNLLIGRDYIADTDTTPQDTSWASALINIKNIYKLMFSVNTLVVLQEPTIESFLDLLLFSYHQL